MDGIIGRGVFQPERVASIPNGCDLDIFDQPIEVWRPEGVNHDDLMAILQVHMV